MIIVLLLFLHFRRVSDTLIVLFSFPFALVGGVWLMWWSGYSSSTATDVGFIALAGLAAETGVVMLVYLNLAYTKFAKLGPMTRARLKESIMEGAVHRVRPKIMTVATTIAGLLPIMWGTGTGSVAMKRIAAPMIGGLVSSTILTLVVIPAIYYMVHAAKLPSE